MGRLFLTACEIKFTSRDALHRTLHLWSLSLFCYKLHLSQLSSRNEILGSHLHLKVNFKKCDLRSLYRDYVCSVTTLKKEINTFVCLDCVASVFNWVITRKLERERKKKSEVEGVGVGVGRRGNSVSFSPFLSPFIPLVCYRLNFLDEPTRKRSLCRLSCALVFFFSCLLLPWEIWCHSIY